MLSPTRKRELREEMIKDRIRNTVDGACTKQELVASAGLNPDARSNEYAKGVAMINSMVKRRIISFLPTTQFRKTWSVVTDVKVTPSPKEMAASVMPKDIMVALQEYPTVEKMKLVDMAKEFAWQNNSDSLREFIQYVQNAIK